MIILYTRYEEKAKQKQKHMNQAKNLMNFAIRTYYYNTYYTCPFVVAYIKACTSVWRRYHTLHPSVSKMCSI